MAFVAKRGLYLSSGHFPHKLCTCQVAKHNSKCIQYVTRRQQKSFRVLKVQAGASQGGAYPDAILFDCDGVLVDTEKDGHRVSFNSAFRQRGLKCQWSVEEYGELVKTGGGKERMTKYFSNSPDKEPWASLTSTSVQAEYVLGLHLLKTELFMEMIDAGKLPLRPGVARLVSEAMEAGVTVAVCSTSNERAVENIVKVMLGPEVASAMRVFAGDCVPCKKPDPAIYLLAAQELGLDPTKCVVVEDSHIGLSAAKAANMRCIVTKSGYTEDEDFSQADAVFSHIGESEDKQVSLEDLRLGSSLWKSNISA
mmetsp:Transcript_13473/g.18456  ORF Transcript_13473/g.18456 Transcript_13473/m.18456 type:complete len:309 (-) Transcript_13473:88-1014(-)|eukprot:CAMPEP_0196577682 /NCGR_PEP_ID=MMETSP1081-20130531/6706_1 /TAXON_ID=36882 /ORGANISM="Pyramimonas amylifera, Strain CCMP720" /LENGTH=308 /DNA_ID=CAMNT_0041896665 /DNA_START=102 /DNA_END=1028 /DNA_ORIENTATION=-